MFFENPSIFLAYTYEPYIYIWQFFSNLGPVLASENLRMHLILAILIFLIFLISLFGYI